MRIKKLKNRIVASILYLIKAPFTCVFSLLEIVSNRTFSKLVGVQRHRPANSGRPMIIGCFFSLGFLIVPLFVCGAERDIQIRAIDFERQVVILTNYGASAESLTGWRFCSHDASNVRQYSNSGGLTNVTLAVGESLFIHFLNDASAANEINISAIGGNFATPLDADAYGLQLYFPPVFFGIGATIADHLQWGFNGIDNMSADERSDEAENGGVWVDQTQWIATSPLVTQIILTDRTGGVLHSPDDYRVLPENFAVPLLPLPWLMMLAALLLLPVIKPFEYCSRLV